jgi:hypothetical protein
MSEQGVRDERSKIAKALVPGAGSSVQGGSTSTGAQPTCRMKLGSQAVSVPCRLRPMLSDAYRRDPALAGFLAAAAGGS